MGTPYTSGPHIVEVEGSISCHVLRCPSRGIITAIKFEQISGADADCDFEIFTRAGACPPGTILGSGSSTSSESLTEGVEGPRSAYSVFGSKSHVAGTPFEEYEANYGYQNNDDGPNGRPSPTNRQRKLYLELRPADEGAKEYAITFEIEVSPIN